MIRLGSNILKPEHSGWLPLALNVRLFRSEQTRLNPKQVSQLFMGIWARLSNRFSDIYEEAYNEETR